GGAGGGAVARAVGQASSSRRRTSDAEDRNATYYQFPMQRSLHLLLIAHTALSLTACKAEDCEPDFAEGDQFLFTVLAVTEPEGDHCHGEYPQLAPGDTFILEGGTRFETGHSACNI